MAIARKNQKQTHKKYKVWTSAERSRVSRRITKILNRREETVRQILYKQNSNPNANSNVNITLSSNNSLDDTLEYQLVDWIIDYGIAARAVNGLLSILNSFGGQSLPKDSRTLLKTDTKIEIVSKAGGDFWYNGFRKCLLRVFGHLDEDKSIRLKFNMDGLPLFKSSKHTFWPILCSIHGKHKFIDKLLKFLLISI